MLIVQYDNLTSFMKEYRLVHQGKVYETDLNVEFHWFDRFQRMLKEANILATIAKNARPGLGLDLGTSEGRSALEMARNIPPGGQIWTVNILPEQITGDMKLITHAMPKKQIGNMIKNLPNVMQFYSDTQSVIIPPGIKFEFIFVDACHDRTYVYKDSMKFWPYLRTGGFIMWHDFNSDLRYTPGLEWINEVMCGVEDFVEEMDLENNPISHIKDTWIGIMEKP